MPEEEVKVEEGKESAEVSIEDLAGDDLNPNLQTGMDPEEEKPKEEVKAEPEKKALPDPYVKVKDLEAQLKRISADKKDLQKALHEARQERKKPKEPEPDLSYDELVKIVEENKGDAKVLLNASAYYAKQQMRKAKGEAVDEIEVKNKKAELDQILHNRVKDFSDESSETRRAITSMREGMHLGDHPFGDFLSTAALMYMNIDKVREELIEQGKKMALEASAEASRVKKIKETQPVSGGPKKAAGDGSDGSSLSETQMETAKRLGFTTPAKLKLYRNILKGGVAPERNA